MFTVPPTPAPGITVVRIATTGTVLDPGGIALDAAHSNSQSTSAVAGASGGGLRVVWQDTRAGGINPDDIYRTIVSASSTPGVASCISLGAPSQTQPALAHGNTGTMVVFASDVSGSRRIMAHPLDTAGNALLPQPIQLAAGPSLGTDRQVLGDPGRGRRPPRASTHGRRHGGPAAPAPTTHPRMAPRARRGRIIGQENPSGSAARAL